MSDAAELLGASFMPALALSLALAVGWRFVPAGRVRVALQVVATLLFFLPQLAVLLWLNRSLALLFYQDFVLVVWFALIAAGSLGMPPFHRRSRKRPESRWRRTFTLLLGLLFAGAAVVWGLRLAQDLLRPRIVVEGRITEVSSRRGTRAPRSYQLAIDGLRYSATRDVWHAARRATSARAEIGAGSGRILAFSPR